MKCLIPQEIIFDDTAFRMFQYNASEIELKIVVLTKSICHEILVGGIEPSAFRL